MEHTGLMMTPVGLMTAVAGVAVAGLAGAISLAPGLSTPAEAAVRTCQPMRSSGIVAGASEADGKRRAIAGWMLKVRPLGPKYMGWATASRRFLKCVRGKTGQFECIAMAMPCTVQQNPGLPGRPGRPPNGRRRPGDPGQPISI